MARILSLDEAIGRESVWVEMRTIPKAMERKLSRFNDWQIQVSALDGKPVYFLDEGYYGICERAWDEMPDEEQQKNVPWVPWPDLGMGIDVRKGRKKRDDD